MNKEILKKYSFLIVIIITALLHLLLKNIGLDITMQKSAIFVLWVTTGIILFSLIMEALPRNKEWRNLFALYKKNNITKDGISEKENELYLYKNGIKTVAVVEKVLTRVYGKLNVGVLIQYSFKSNDNTKRTKVKLYVLMFHELYPKIGDKIEVSYDEKDSNNSIVVFEEVKKVATNNLQEKYQIKIIK